MNKIQIGLGTAAIGRPVYINIKKEKSAAFTLDVFRQRGIDILDAAYAQGIRYFDTAPGYGMAEEMLKDWAINSGKRDIEIATKWGYTYVANFDPNAVVHEIKEHSIEKLNEQWEISQGLLPFLTTYQIHSATFESGVLKNKKVLHRLAELKNEHGLQMGLSTSGSNQVEVLKEAMDIEVDGTALFTVFQVTYNVFEQSLATVADEIARTNIKLVIKEALANGRVFPNEKFQSYTTAYTHMNGLATKYNVGVDAVALRFCMDSIPAFRVLSGAANKLHLSDNLKVNQFTLKDEDVAILRELAVDSDFYWKQRKELAWN
ncbi:MAG: aldo/keto reductase [Saprospiraceae bacterium]|nr:aldo/keto reductase [Saprospiraceae bacterium]